MNGMGRGSGENGNGREGRGVVVWTAGEGVGLSVGCALPIDDLVVIGNHGGRPPGMASGCSASFREVLEVLVIGVDLKWMLGPLHIHTPVLEALHHY